MKNKQLISKKIVIHSIQLFLIFLFIISCESKSKSQKFQPMENITTLDTITLGAGCFWCVEAVYLRLKGVVSVNSGYSGGPKPNPSYKEVCTGTSGHAEVCQIVFDTSKISLNDILAVFFAVHDPTTLNKQGADVGTQYRSVIFYHNQLQKEIAEKMKQQLDASKEFPNPIVTEISPASEFYKAEDYHQNYFDQNTNQPYCKFVIQPKIDKFQKLFKSKMK